MSEVVPTKAKTRRPPDTEAPRPRAAHDESVATDPRSYHAARQNVLDARAATLDARDRRYSWLRGITFLAAAGVGIAAGVARSTPAGVGAGILAASFVVFVVLHARVATQQFELRVQRELVARALARLAGTFRSVEHRGDRFVDDRHLFATDLDVFGHGSLFEQVNGTETRDGETRLASWLSEHAPPEQALARQRAARELAALPALREHLALEARRVGRRAAPAAAFQAWLEARPDLGPLRQLALGLSALLALATWTLLTAQASTTSATKYGLAAAAVQLAWLLVQRRTTEAALGPICDRQNPLGRWARLIAVVEGASFEDPTLVRLSSVLRPAGGPPASRQMARLESLIGFASARHNPIGQILLNALTGWDAFCAFALDRWRARVGPQVGPWLEALAEFEALASVGAYAHDHPDLAWPELEAEGTEASFEATALAHPLLATRGAVPNDVTLTHAAPALVITGSNMSGKSTLLRAMGLAAVMAQAGLPVCARRLRMSPLRVRPSIRIVDSLDEGTSHFLREVQRLKAVLDSSVGGETPVLFLLDEVLHGTNSRERILGASAVVRELVSRGAIGAVSSHDLGLVGLEQETHGSVRNTHFEDHIEDGRMRFDYRMRVGPVGTSNALRLMRSVGLDLDYRDGSDGAEVLARGRTRA